MKQQQCELQEPACKLDRLPGRLGKILWLDYMTTAWFDRKLNGEGVTQSYLALDLGVDIRSLQRKLHEEGVHIYSQRVPKVTQLYREAGRSVGARSLPGLIRAIDASRHPPQTLEEAQKWATRWQAVERLIHPGQAGWKAALWITPEDILVIVRTKKYRTSKSKEATLCR